MSSIFREVSDRLFILHGNTKDEFVTNQLTLVRLEQWLVDHFKSQGYQRVCFFSPNKKLHYIDAESARLGRNTSIPSPQTDASDSLPRGRSGRSTPMGGRVKNTTQRNSSQPIDLPIYSSDVQYDYGSMSDTQAYSALDRLMKEPIKTIVIFRNGEDVFGHLDTDAIRWWDNTLDSWTSLPIDNENKAVFIFVNNVDIELLKRNMPRTSKHFLKDDLLNPNNSFYVGSAREDEVERLLHSYRLSSELSISPSKISQISLGLAQRLVPQEAEDSLKKISAIKKMVQNAHIDTSPWDQINAMTGMDLLKDKIEKIIARAKKNLNQQSSIHDAITDTGIRRLMPRKSVNNDQLSNLHLALMGPPGTGKTTVARHIANIYREEGLLELGHLVEVNPSQLIEEHIGGTAKRTMEYVQRALDGVLFIDEAYGLTENEFGEEAVTVLLKAMSDYQGQFSIIIAGYNQKIKDFIEGRNANPGLSRRFPEQNRLELSGYNHKTLYDIFCKEIAKAGYRLDVGLSQLLPKAFESWHKAQDHETFGNVGSVKNLVENLLTYALDDEFVLTTHTFKLLSDTRWQLYLGISQLPTTETLLSSLNNMIGLKKVRKELTSIANTLRLDIDRNGSVHGVNLGHFIFSGNPGTGKTEVAKKMGQLLKLLSLIQKADPVIRTASQLLGTHVGEAERNTEDAIIEAKNGILFIDEAHQLAEDNNQYGQRVLKTLVPEMENRRNTLCVILAGYPEDMQKLLDKDPGLNSRVKTIEFEDYTHEELFLIAQGMIQDRGLELNDTAGIQLQHLLAFMVNRKDKNFGNAREVRNLVDEMKQNLANRYAHNPTINKHQIALEDIPGKRGFNIDDWRAIVSGEHQDINRVMKALNELVGLSNVKSEIEDLSLDIKVKKKTNGGSVSLTDLDPGHFIFSGNPGTGKTTVARLMGNMFLSLGVLKKGHVVEVKREDIIGAYQGQTEEKISAKIEEALDGVLFIDEAYQLTQDSNDSYGKIAVNVLVARMTEYRSRLCVIAAGYPKDMEGFKSANPGFSRRFKTIHFDNYTVDELLIIAKRSFEKEKLELSPDAELALSKLLDRWEDKMALSSFGNAGDVENLVKTIKRNKNKRLERSGYLDDPNSDPALLYKIIDSDVIEAIG